MFKYIVEQLPNSQVFGIFSLLFFFSIFVIILIRVWKSDKDYLRKMAHMPLESSSNGDQTDE
jgi:hypothetical protein